MVLLIVRIGSQSQLPLLKWLTPVFPPITLQLHRMTSHGIIQKLGEFHVRETY